MNFVYRIVTHTCITFLLLYTATVAAALDPPHDSLGCLECHDMTAFDLPNLIPNPSAPDPYVSVNIDDTIYNTTVCWKCHLAGNPTPGIQTHSSRMTHQDLATVDNQNGWTVECWVCHNQHAQEQDRTYGTSYGKFIRTRIDRANITDGGKTGLKSVKFTGKTGPGSFADGDGTYNGICEVCHETTDHYQDDGSAADQNHSYIAKLAANNPNLTTQENCTFCHNHQDGFRPSCPDCHGFPPTVATQGGPNGLAGPGNVRIGASHSAPAATGSATNGQHALHATSSGYNYPCDTCHYGGMTMTMTADDPKVDNKIQVGFNVEVKDSSSIPAYSTYIVDTSIYSCWKGTQRNCGLTITGTGQQVPPSEIENFVGNTLATRTVDGSGTIYDGQAALAGRYDGQHGTTTSTGDSKKCSSVYCHTDGKALIDPVMYAPNKYPPRYKGNVSPPWDAPGDDPQNDGFKCNNCHDYPPRYDAHQVHDIRGVKCDRCHDGIVADSDNDGIFDTIMDKTKHANGRVDIVSAPQFWFQNSWHSLDIAYIPKPGGGTCINRCHSYISFTDPKVWTNRPIPAAIKTSASWAPSGNQLCGTPGMQERTMAISVSRHRDDSLPNDDFTGPYYYKINWGDGIIDDCSYNPAQDPPSPDCRVASTSFTHAYQYDINSRSYPDRAYDITWTISDSEGIPMTTPDPRTNKIVVCPQTNVQPVFTWTFQKGPNPSRYDLTVNVIAKDPDFNTGSHSGPAKIKIDWAGYALDGSGKITEETFSLTNIDAQYTKTFTYDRGGTYAVKVYIDDNAPEEGYTAPVMKIIRVLIDSVQVQ